MSHKQIYAEFEALFPEMASHVETWFLNGKDSIRLRWANKKEFIFTFKGGSDWRFETISYFMNNGGLK